MMAPSVDEPAEEAVPGAAASAASGTASAHDPNVAAAVAAAAAGLSKKKKPKKAASPTPPAAASAAAVTSAAAAAAADSVVSDASSPGKQKSKGNRQHHQLPMFLSKTYHMINRCDPSVATWNTTGENFIIKNVDTFASIILPQYFKHSNFSSFARQLNFYGFRKVKSEPICLADADEHTSAYISFYNEYFKKDRPDLLIQIKRATKSEQQTTQENNTLRAEIAQLRHSMTEMQVRHDAKVAELRLEMNQRLNALAAQNAALVQQIQQHCPGVTLPPVNGLNFALPTAPAAPQAPADLMQSLVAAALPSALAGVKRSAADASSSSASSSQPNTKVPRS